MSTATSITALMTFGFSPQMTNLWVNGQPEGLFITLGGLTGGSEASPSPFVISGKTATGSGAVQGGTLTLIGGTPTATGAGGAQPRWFARKAKPFDRLDRPVIGHPHQHLR